MTKINPPKTPVKKRPNKRAPATRRPPCPRCGKSVQVLPIFYGLPSDELWRSPKAKRVVFGGCCISAGSPAWHCDRCDVDFGRLDDGT
jgi:hypothetical protein